MNGKQTINLNWRFHLGDVKDAGFMGYDDRAWCTVTLPHDWAVEHPFDPGYASGTGYLPGGTAWYRKHFELGEDAAGKRVRVTFLGVYKHARVWINSNYLGSHAYGYTSFSFDITEFVRPGENVLAVRVEHEDVADSRWYTGSGIDRDVVLEITDPVCFKEHGIFVKTLSVDEETARIRVEFDTCGASGVRFLLLDQTGRVAQRWSADSERGHVEFSVVEPQLWSPASPYLYTLKCTPFYPDWMSSSEKDTISIPVGIRTARFDPDHGFFLNGVNMKIKGVCVHHDAGCLGAAVPKEVWRRRLLKFKEMGCNAIRTAHNPPDPDLLDLCDEMGFLVMDEAFDEWEGVKNKWWQGHNVYPPKHYGYGEDFPQWHETDLRSMVLRDRNHPSVILWSIGNEIDYPNDPYVTPLFREAMGNNDANKPLAERLYDVRKPDAGRLAKVAKKLVAIVHELDDSRPVTSALSFPELSNHTGFADELDLSGYNYREHFYEDDHKVYPGRVLLGSENSHSPEAWHAVRDHDFIAGQFLWTGVDFLGECPGWPLRISQAGALNLAGFEKPLFYQRMALWTDKPFIHIAVGEGKDHGAWGECFLWDGKEGQEKRVSIYTSGKEAELFLNGQSLGVQQTRDGRAVWQAAFVPGTLTARAGDLETSLSTPGKAAGLSLSASTDSLRADGQDIAQVAIYLLDAAGKPAADEIIYCQVSGDARLLGIENGRPDDLTPYAEPFRATWEGRAIAYLRAGTLPGAASLRVWTRSGLDAQITWQMKAE